ncbi:hypothetical protein LEP1GSC125_0256 [Leptospira mayottensis 200901122]|uniref:Uncharacterized protein n=1 Tax=Leptospira mayottensis 200901122 TaxID=1193010 RepID=A0AA87MTS4_9LEPT|nr:hypothetical protein LEP1GSC125_0256 [Leptospira mayottensis 200901122]
MYEIKIPVREFPFYFSKQKEFWKKMFQCYNLILDFELC